MVKPKLHPRIAYLFQLLCVAAALLLLGTGDQALAQSVTGKVFLDRDEDGLRSENEPGLEGVMVSNQRDVVLTDAAGEYTIGVQPGQSVMVVKPAGYDVPVDQYGIPQFSAIHSPAGSPEGLKYKGLSPTTLVDAGPLNFPLLAARTEETFDALIFGDPQPRDDEELTYVRDTFIGQAANEDVPFMIVLGDIMYNDLSLFDRYKTLIEQTGKTVWHVVGNHDLNMDVQGNRYARDTFKRHFGPNYYAFEYGNVFFVMLDNVDFTGNGEEGGGKYKGRVWGDQLEWLEAVLRHVPASRQIVVGTHIPIYAWGGDSENVNTSNRRRLFEVLDGREQVLMVSGHLHMTYHNYLDEEYGWMGEQPIHQLTTATVSGTWWGGPKDENLIPIATQRDGVPNGYHRFTFTDSTYSERFVGLGTPPEQQLRIETFLETPRDGELPSEFVVNVFSGSPDSKVWYRVAGQDWQEMSRVTQASPYYERLLSQFKDDWSSSLRAIPTNHLWSGELSNNLPAGTHRIDVKTEDPYGKTYRASKIVEVR